MKKLLLGSVALIVMSVPVLAADMPVKAVPLPPAFSWTGCYVGLNVGYSWARFQKSNVTAVGIPPVVPTNTSFADFDFDDDGVNGGGQIGCNWQFGVVVWGVETDLQVVDLEARQIFDNSIFNFPQAGAFDTDVKSSIRYFGTLRGRLGWTVWPTTLLYVTGGLAYARVQSSLAFPTAAGAPNAFVNFDSQTHFGYTVGFGAEVEDRAELHRQDRIPLYRRRQQGLRLPQYRRHQLPLGSAGRFPYCPHRPELPVQLVRDRGGEILIKPISSRKAPGNPRGFFVARLDSI